MANYYVFSTPARVEVPLSDTHPLWSRIRTKTGVALWRKTDLTWTEEESLPQDQEANADYLFGYTGRSALPAGKGFGVNQDSHGNNLETPADQGYFSPLRIYRGGRNYVIDDTLRNELIAAVTTYEPAGYGAYISGAIAPGQRIRVGDEIILSGRSPEDEQSTAALITS